MVRIQGALPDRYTAASPEQLEAWIGEARAALGDRLLILGHHYQREEVMRWADARGDSFGLSRLAAGSTAEYIVFNAANTAPAAMITPRIAPISLITPTDAAACLA